MTSRNAACSHAWRRVQIVILGLVAALIPSLIGTDGKPVDATSTAIWSAVLILSCVPMCLSSVYKEKALGDTEIDPIYLNYWVAVYQFLLSFPLLIPSGYASEVPVGDLPTNLWRGVLCFVGRSSVDTDNCGPAPYFTSLYILFNLGYNVLIIMVSGGGDAWGAVRRAHRGCELHCHRACSPPFLRASATPALPGRCSSTAPRTSCGCASRFRCGAAP